MGLDPLLLFLPLVVFAIGRDQRPQPELVLPTDRRHPLPPLSVFCCRLLRDVCTCIPYAAVFLKLQVTKCEFFGANFDKAVIVFKDGTRVRYVDVTYVVVFGSAAVCVCVCFVPSILASVPLVQVCYSVHVSVFYCTALHTRFGAC